MLDNSKMYQGETDASTSDDELYRSYEIKELSQLFAKLLLQLPKDQQQVVQLHYFEQVNLVEIAKQLGLSRSRVSQLHKNALCQLRSIYAASG